MSTKKQTGTHHQVVETFEDYTRKDDMPNIMKTPDTFVEDDSLYEMATFRPNTTGLPYSVWISTKEGMQHDVLVKVSHNPLFPQNETAIIALRPDIHWLTGMRLDSGDFLLVKQWIELNYDTIMAFWNREIIYTEDLLAAIKRLG